MEIGAGDEYLRLRAQENDAAEAGFVFKGGDVSFEFAERGWIEDIGRRVRAVERQEADAVVGSCAGDGHARLFVIGHLSLVIGHRSFVIRSW
jgi:hypothetical protein